MRGKVNLLAERASGTAIIAGILDEESWDAIGIAAITGGELRDPKIFDWTAGPVGQVSYDEGDFPVPITLNHEVTAEVMSLNNSPGSGNCRCTVWFKDPDGLTKGSHTETFSLDPYSAIYTATTRVSINKKGTWKLHALLEAI